MQKWTKLAAIFGLAGIAGACAATTAGQADNGQAEAASLAGLEKTGETTNCLPLQSIRDTDIISDTAIIYTVTGGQKYINELNGSCTRLAREGRFSYKTTQNRACSGDILSVTDEFGTFLGSCSLGDFERLSPAE